MLRVKISSITVKPLFDFKRITPPETQIAIYIPRQRIALLACFAQNRSNFSTQSVYLSYITGYFFYKCYNFTCQGCVVQVAEDKRGKKTIECILYGEGLLPQYAATIKVYPADRFDQ